MIDLANDPLYKAAVVKYWADKKAAAETPLAKFLEPSEVKQRMYHGTGQDIRQFKPKQAGASFVTPDPKFAHDFADLSESWMKRNAGTILTGEQIERAKDLTAKELTKRMKQRKIQSYEREIALIGSSQAHPFTQTLYANQLAEQLPSAQNIMPVHVQAKKPFDYENPKHIHAVRTMLHKLGHTQHIDDFDTAMRGGKGDDANWHTIESKPVQQAIRALGHDSFWVKEGGVKNLGVYNPGAIKSAIGNRGTYDTEDYDVNKAQGGAVKPVKLKEGQQPPYQDPKTSKIDDWKWHPMERIRQELSARRELPEHVTPYADYMREMNAKAQAGELTPRDLVKAYTITQSSIGRGGLSHSTATKRGMKLPNTGGEVRPEGAFAEWLGSPMGQKYLEASMRGEEHPEAMEDLRAKFAPFGKQNAQVEAMQYATQNAPSLGERLNKAITGSKADYRKYAGGIKGIAGAKSGFIGSLLGRGDLPTLDARQLNLHSLSHPTKTPEGMMSRGKGLGGQEAVDRLIARQDALGYSIPDELKPYAQHLIHHDVWDQRGGTKTTHEDLIKAMRGYADGGDVEQMRQQITAAQRAAAGNKAAAMIKKTPQVKLSEALGNLNVEGRGELTSTQADRTRVGGGNIGGPAFSALGLADPNYAGNAWGVMDAGTASRLTNLNKPDTIWTPMLGSAEQLKTNPIVFDKMGKAFRNQVKAGKLSPELRIAINAKLAPLFGEDTDITKPKFWQGIDTFDKRAAVADALMGKQLGGELRGGAIIPATDILKSETEPTLMHPLHGGVTPTYALGPRLFKMTGKTEYRPDLHPGFPTLLKGEDLGHNVHPTETQIALPDWHERFKQLYPNRKAPPGYYDLALGFKGEGLPSQKITEAYLKHLQKHGRAAGGSIGYAKGGNVSMDEMLAHTTLGKKAPNVRNIGADEAPDMKVKQYMPPGPSNGLGLPAGGVDFQPEMPGQQLSQAAPAGPGGPAMPGMPGMPPGAPGMPPGGPGPGMPGMPPPLPRNQPGMPTGKPAGLEPPNIPPPKQKPTGSNILSMTPQGQALAALGPMRKMAKGGAVDDTDYRGEHAAPGPESGKPMHDTTDVYPADFYGPRGFEYYANTHQPYDRASYNTVAAAKGKPDKMVWVHRAVPKDVYNAAMKTSAPTAHMIRPGDWVTPSREYARDHGESLGEGHHIARQRVPAKHLYTNADSIHEWGYHPEPMRKMAEGGPVASRAFQEVEAPKKTTKAYKLFRTHPKHPGKLFPLFVDANEPVEQGKWLAAQAGESAGEKVKSKIGPLAYRPGWHGGDLPIATHIGSKSTSRLKKPDIRPDNHVWAEVEMPNDVDWHSEAQRRGTNAQGRVVPVKSHITDQVPTGGHYRYKTNANMTGNWLIGGSMKVNRVLPDKEVAAINKAAGVADLPRQQPQDLSKLGFGKTKVTLPPSTEQMRQALSARRSNSKA